MKKRNIALAGITVILALVAAGLKFGSKIYWEVRDISDPHWVEKVEKSYMDKSEDFLLKKFNGGNANLAYVAANVLKERNDIDVSEEMMKIIIKSKDSMRIATAIHILAYKKDKNVIPVLQAIVKEGRQNNNYLDALEGLAQLGDDKIYPEILQMAEDKYEVSYVVDLLEYYPDKRETVIALQQIAINDTEGYVRYKAEKALKKIAEHE